MSWEPRPLPDLTPETERFWQAAAEKTFLLRNCSQCDLTHYYPRSFCPDCFSEDVEWIEADGTGHVYSYSIVEAKAGWPDDALPLVVAYVELAEGPRVLTNIIGCDPTNVAVGLPVQVRFVETEREIAIPVFEGTGTSDGDG